MWKWILKALRIVREIACALCGTTIMNDIAKRHGWVKTAQGWLCPSCEAKRR